MTQSRQRSAVEAVTNIAVGGLINWSATLFIFPLLGYQVSAADAGWATVFFTGVSFARSYLLRRLFNRGDDCES